MVSPIFQYIEAGFKAIIGEYLYLNSLGIVEPCPALNLLFVAPQVARVAGLKDLAISVSDFIKLPTHRVSPGQSPA